MLEENSSILGLLQMKKRRTYWDLSSFVINYQHRGNGYGKKMIECCIANADAPVCLQVRQENPAYCLYRGLGFQTEGFSDGRYYMKYK
jgi:ribosomal protein S18 acetylase RimI-like enzyme